MFEYLALLLYRGEFLKFEDWNLLKINFDLHLNKIRTIIKEKLAEHQ